MLRPIVVEGPDGAGKSTLVDYLAKTLGRSVYHSGGPILSKGVLEDLLTATEAALESRTIVDRAPHISEPIYAKAGFRRQFLRAQLMHSRLAEFSPIVVYCRRASLGDMFKSIDRTPKPHKPAKHLEDVLRDYRDLVFDYDKTMIMLPKDHPKIQVIRYDWATSTPSALLRDISCVG